MSRERLLHRFDRVLRWKHLALALLVIATLLLHFSIIFLPDTPMFDEQFYVPDARNILNSHYSERGEHPPLGKLLVVAGVAIFGDNQAGWRFFSVIFSTITIIAFYFICRRLGMSEKATLLATFLLSFENLTFIQGSIAMLDVFFLTFAALAFLFYLQGRYVIAGIVIGLAALAKLNGFLALPVIGLHWLLVRRDKKREFIFSCFLVFVTFVGLWPFLEYIIFRNWSNPFDTIFEMFRSTGSITFSWVTHEAASQPWKWLYKPPTIAYWYNPNYYGTLSYTLWALMIPITLYLLWRVWRRDNAAMFGLAFAGMYYLWIPIVLITDRVTYPYYLYAGVGGFCIGIALLFTNLLAWMRRKKWKWRSRVMIGAIVTYCLGHVAVLLILSAIVNRPRLTG